MPQNSRMMSSVVDYDSFFTRVSLRRKPPAIRALQPLLSVPGMISLGGGMPNPALFPFATMRLTTVEGEHLEPTASEFEEALQYSSTAGLPELCSRLRLFQEQEHEPQIPFEVMVTPGSQDGLAKLFDMLVEDGKIFMCTLSVMINKSNLNFQASPSC